MDYHFSRAAHFNDAISPGDRMFKGDRDQYFAVGQSAMDCIDIALRAARITSVSSILDMPSGHGRVLRHLQAAFPAAQVTACDIEIDAVDYCSKTLGAKPVYAKELPKDMTMPDTYDLIFVGSLLTHLNADRCVEFLQLFRRILRPGGLLLFTTHGHFVARKMRDGVSTYGLLPETPPKLVREYQKKGFSYANYPKKKTFGVSENYGVSLSSPAWIFGQLEKMEDLEMVNFTEKGWDQHQDVVACVRR